MEAKPATGTEGQWATRRFYKKMRDALHTRTRGYWWHKDYAESHRDTLMNIATGSDHVTAHYAVQVLKELPRELTPVQKIGMKIRHRFERWRNYIVNRLPDQIGPFKIP